MFPEGLLGVWLQFWLFKTQFEDFWDFGVKTNSVMIPPVCLAGALFFQKKHVPFQKNTYIGVLG